ncbi:MAG TPA: diacylglycerol kinase family protein [Phycisphaerales bacterium]|nr:diacylglycerol kinase family protein [Phycisphaerales bacterium]
MPRVAIILNASSGPLQTTPAQLEPLLRSAGIEATVHCPQGEEKVDVIARSLVAGGVETVVAAGGDGTVSAVASVLVGSGSALGILPLGTFNHLAKDLRIPLTLEGAVANLASGVSRAIDVGEVNGRRFLNNLSIGVYPAFVEARGEARRLPKVLRYVKRAWAMLRVFRRLPQLWVHIDVDGQRLSRITPAVLVGNNEYRLDAPGAGTRSTLSDGRLSLVITRRRGPRGLIMQALRASLGRLRGSRDLDELCGREITIRTSFGSIKVGIDGEIVRMKTPLRCRVLPGALRVIVPAEA